MISVRENVFETNSSSCHSLTLTTSKDKLERFNKGELFYCYMPDVRREDFFTAEEICGALLILGSTGNYEFISDDWHRFTDGCLDFWDDSKAVDKIDRTNYLKWFFANLNPEMIEWAFSETDTTPKYVSKKLIKLTIQILIEDNFNSPIVKINDLFDVASKKWHVCSIYEAEYSDARLDEKTKQLKTYTDKETYDIRLEFRA